MKIMTVVIVVEENEQNDLIARIEALDYVDSVEVIAEDQA